MNVLRVLCFGHVINVVFGCHTNALWVLYERIASVFGMLHERFEGVIKAL